MRCVFLAKFILPVRIELAPPDVTRGVSADVFSFNFY